MRVPLTVLEFQEVLERLLTVPMEQVVESLLTVSMEHVLEGLPAATVESEVIVTLIDLFDGVSRCCCE